MKNVLLILLAMIICGCSSEPKTTYRPTVVKGVYSNWDTIIVVNGCQYGIFYTYNSHYVYTHLGDCTNCWAKMETLIGKKLNTEKE